MIHKPISIKNLSLSFPYKTCFEDFNTQISYGSRVAIIGHNGSGKSTLLKVLQGMVEATSGYIKVPGDVTFGYVPQVIGNFDSLSGGQRLNKAVTQAISLDPNILLLDEPTNHLDRNNRKSLIRMLYTYPGTLIVVSHDTELLRNCIDILWHIDHGKIHVFSGNYDDYTREIRIKRTSIEQELSRLNFQRKDMHHALMKEQQRAAKSKIKGQKSIDQQKWPAILSKLKATCAEKTSGRKKLAIDHKKYELSKQLSNLRLPEIIVPKFSLNSSEIGNYTLVSIRNGTIGYQIRQNILKDITLSLSSKDRIAIIGNNGSGKSTLVKAILADQKVIKTGSWHIPKQEDIGYLDQHYETLSPEKSILEFMLELVPSWSHAEVRKHLNDFLFPKNEEVNALISQLSGGEKARLSLAKIAAKTPKLLILDEITNNLDFETKAHVTKVLKEYPGAMIIISHDEDLLREIEICDTYTIKDCNIMYA